MLKSLVFTCCVSYIRVTPGFCHSFFRFLYVDFQVKVMHKQLLLFHNAISAYFAGNQQQLEQTLRQFNVKLKPPGSDKPSWLEEQWSLCQCKETLKHGNLKIDEWGCKEMHYMWFVWMIKTREVDVFILPNPGKCSVLFKARKIFRWILIWLTVVMLYGCLNLLLGIVYGLFKVKWHGTNHSLSVKTFTFDEAFIVIFTKLSYSPPRPVYIFCFILIE